MYNYQKVYYYNVMTDNWGSVDLEIKKFSTFDEAVNSYMEEPDKDIITPITEGIIIED